MVAVPEIPADAELARDLLFGNGRLLLAAGSRLSARTKDAIGELLAIAGLPAQVCMHREISASALQRGGLAIGVFETRRQDTHDEFVKCVSQRWVVGFHHRQRVGRKPVDHAGLVDPD